MKKRWRSIAVLVIVLCMSFAGCKKIEKATQPQEVQQAMGLWEFQEGDISYQALLAIEDGHKVLHMRRCHSGTPEQKDFATGIWSVYDMGTEEKPEYFVNFCLLKDGDTAVLMFDPEGETMQMVEEYAVLKKVR